MRVTLRKRRKEGILKLDLELEKNERRDQRLLQGEEGPGGMCHVVYAMHAYAYVRTLGAGREAWQARGPPESSEFASSALRRFMLTCARAQSNG